MTPGSLLSPLKALSRPIRAEAWLNPRSIRFLRSSPSISSSSINCHQIEEARRTVTERTSKRISRLIACRTVSEEATTGRSIVCRTVTKKATRPIADRIITDRTTRSIGGRIFPSLGSGVGIFAASGFSESKRCIASAFMARGVSSEKAMSSAAGEKEGAMLLITFEKDDGQRTVGVLREDLVWSVQELVDSSHQIADMDSVIKNWSEIKDKLVPHGKGTPLSEVRILAPFPKPSGVIMCIGKNYLDHVNEVDSSVKGNNAPSAPKHPIVFTKAPQSVIGPGAAIRYPHGVSSAVDYEAELGVIIGKAGFKIKKSEAMDHVFGYTIINDVTARDLQKKHQQWFIGKSCDTFCPMGPGIVPAGEIDEKSLQIQCWINEELRQNGNSSQMIFGIPELIETISECVTLHPGDIIATGTPSGVGSGFKPPRHLAPGDKVRIRIEGIGELSNTVE